MKAARFLASFALSAIFSAFVGIGVAQATGADPSSCVAITACVTMVAGIVTDVATAGSAAGSLHARVSNPLIGRSANKIGNVVFSTWKGINVLKEKPASVANPRTDGQVAQRSAMSQLVAIARSILSTLQISFREMAVQMSAYNAFVKYNLTEAFTISGATATLNVADLKVAKGTLADVIDFDSTVDTGRTYDLTWTDNTGGSGANASDKLNVVVIASDASTLWAKVPGATRSAGVAAITVPGSWSLTGARICAYFVKADGSQSSDSVNVTLA